MARARGAKTYQDKEQDASQQIEVGLFLLLTKNAIGPQFTFLNML